MDMLQKENLKKFSKVLQVLKLMLLKKVRTGESMKCSSSEFGNVAQGKNKTCFCDETKPEVYKMEKEFIAEKCADENGQCNCTSTIHFGKLGEDFSDMMMLPHKTKEVTG